MPLREAPLTTRCHGCDEPAASSCRRCGRPACREHAPEHKSRCQPCEAELRRQITIAETRALSEPRVRTRSYAAAAAGAVGLSALTTLGAFANGASTIEIAFAGFGMLIIGFFIARVPAMLWSLGGQPGVGLLTRRRIRRRFFAERPGQRRLPPADSNKRRLAPADSNEQGNDPAQN